MSAGKTQLLDRRSYEAGKAIFSQGDQGDVAFVVESGEIGIFKEIDGKTVRLGSVKAGGIFGEMAVIDGSPRMASAVAETHSVLVRVPKTVFDQKMAATDPFIRGLIAIFLENIRSSHKLFARKPRSLKDYLRQLEGYSVDLRTYVNSIDVAEFSPQAAQALMELDAAIQKVRAATAGAPDRRHSVLDDGNLRGVTLRDVLDKG